MIKKILHSSVVNWPDQNVAGRPGLMNAFNQVNELMFNKGEVYFVDPCDEERPIRDNTFMQRVEGTLVTSFFRGSTQFHFEPYSDKNPVPEFKK